MRIARQNKVAKRLRSASKAMFREDQYGELMHVFCTTIETLANHIEFGEAYRNLAADRLEELARVVRGEDLGVSKKTKGKK